MDFRELIVWQKAMDLVDQVYRLSARFPVEERFGLVTQMRRAAVSVPSNIAEGHGTASTRNFLRHLAVASGSLNELWTQAMLSGRLKFLEPQDRDAVLSNCEEVAKMISALRASLRRRLENKERRD